MKAGMKKFMAAAVLMMALVITAGFGATKALAVTLTAKQTGKTTNSISIQWAGSLSSYEQRNGYKIKGYQIEMKEYSGSSDWKVVENLTSGSSMYTITGLKPGTKYSIRVKMPYSYSNGRYESSYSAYAYEEGKYFSTTALTTVTGLKQVKWWYFALSLDVAWNKQEAADGYEVECRKSNGKLQEKKTLTYGTAGNTSFGKIKNEMIYTVKVRAFQNVNGVKKYTNWSAPITCFTQPRITSLKVKNGKLTVKWKKVSGATGYRIYVSTKPKSGYKKVKQVSAKKGSITIKKFKGKKFKAKKSYYVYIQTLKKVNGKVNTSGRLYYWDSRKSASSFGYFN